MPTIFSLNDSSLFLELPGIELLHLKNRIISIETLEGTDSRLLGNSVSDISFTLEAEIDGEKLILLYRYFEKGSPIGYSEQLAKYSCLVSSFEGRRKSNDRYSVKMNLLVTGEI